MALKLNPCDTCDRESCFDCALYCNSSEYECCNDICFLNYEGNCQIGVYDKCGAWRKTYDG